MGVLKFNIPGLDELFDPGIPAGSIFALCGGPGTGKTTLALQMAHFLEVEKDKKEPCNASFLTFDAPTSQVRDLAIMYGFCEETELSKVPIAGIDLKLEINGDEKSISEFIQQIILEQSETAGANLTDSFLNLCRIAFNFSAKKSSGTGDDRNAILVVDGLSSILSYIPLSKRRMALHYLINEFRKTNRLAALVLTLEMDDIYSSPSTSEGYSQFTPENYLADVVFWLMIKELVPDKRRRILEVIKARQAGFPLGENSMWIINKDRLKELQEYPLRGFAELKPGTTVFPIHKSPQVTAVDSATEIEPLKSTSTGIPCLDKMFGKAFAEDLSQKEIDDFPAGVFMSSTTAIVGSAGSGKTLLGLAFILAGLDNVKKEKPDAFPPRIFCSFDVTEEQLLATYGHFYSPEPLSSQKSKGKEITIKEAHKQQLIRIFYRSPDNFDQNLFFWLLDYELKKAQDTCPIERIVLDSISNIQRTIGSGPRFQDFMIDLLALLKRYKVTTMFTYEHPVDLNQSPLEGGPVSFMADNMILMSQVPINDVNRKCAVVVKSRGQSALSNPRELIVIPSIDKKLLTCRVSDSFDEYSQVLRGRPEPVEIHLRLFGENDSEVEFNKSFVEEIRSRYPKIQFSTFTKTDLREILWEHRVVGRSQAMRSDITIVSIDEPWFTQLVLNDLPVYPQSQERLLARLYIPDNPRVDQLRIKQLNSFLPEVMLGSCVDGNFFGLPQYIDMGLLFYRHDVTEKYKIPKNMSLGKIGDINSPDSAEPNSWLYYLSKLSKETRKFSFAIETGVVGNLICPFIELCWNSGAAPDFLLPDNRDDSKKYIRNAMEIFAWLVFHRYMPFPCDNITTKEAIFCRHWYSTFQAMIQTNPNNYNIMKFPVANLSTREKAALEQKIRKHALSVSIGTSKNPNAKETFESLLRKRYYDNYLSDGNDIRPEVVSGGWSCSGCWYTGVLRSGRSVDPGWIIASELVDQERVARRAYAGAGLPPTEEFYKSNWKRAVSGITNATYGLLMKDFFPCVRRRYDIFGFSKEQKNKSNLAYEFYADDLYEILIEFLSECIRNGPSQDLIDKNLNAIFEKADHAYEKVKSM